jgi:hypothetical protein
LSESVILKTPSIYVLLAVKDNLSHPYKTTGKIKYFNFDIFTQQAGRRKIFCTAWQQAFPEFNLLLISS